MVETLRYKPEGTRFDSKMGLVKLILPVPLRPLTGMSTFWEAKGGRCLGLKTLKPSCADCPEIWEPQLPGTLDGLSNLYTDSFTFNLCHLKNLESCRKSKKTFECSAENILKFI